MGILIGADIVPTSSNYKQFSEADVSSLVGEQIENLFKEADFSILNLETPLTDSTVPIDKGGHNMKAPFESSKLLSALGVNLVTLCNNHIMDYGTKGLEDTCNILKSEGIRYFGVGSNVKQASEPFFFRYRNRMVGVYTCAEHEFSIATDNHPGANPYDPLYTFDQIESAKEKCEFLIVLYHGGKEHYRYPSPDLQKRCRRMIEKGADIVICQHSHCVGCKEEYQGGTIIYGQGNFLFDLNNNECWNSGLLVYINDDFKISYIPITKHGNGIRVANQDDVIIREFYRRSEEILENRFVENRYKEFAMNSSAYYLLGISKNRVSMFVFRVINKLTKQRLMENCSLKKIYTGRYYMRLRNFVECEAHRELIITALTNDER